MLYPLTEETRWPVRVLRYADDTQQRFQVAAGLRRFRLVLETLSAADLATVQTFFDARKGAHATDWDITIGGTLYSYLTFEQDEIAAVERTPKLYDVTLTVRQTRKN